MQKPPFHIDCCLDSNRNMQPRFRLTGAATDLGLNVTWRYSFLPAGRVMNPMTDTICIDVGGRLLPGIIDHHHANSARRSCARLVVEHPGLVHEHLVAPWIAANRFQAVNGRLWSPNVVMHRSPDFDAIVTAVVVQSLVSDGMFPADCEALVAYADRVDGGLERPVIPEHRFELYPLILMLQNVTPEAPGLPNTRLHHLAELAGLASTQDAAALPEDELALRLGMHLVHRWLEAPACGANSARKDLRSDPLAVALGESLEQDAGRFVTAKDRYEFLGSIALPSTSNQVVFLPAGRLVACRCEQLACVCNTQPIACDKIYLRLGQSSEHTPATPLTIIEKPRRVRPGIHTPRHHWVISIDPAPDAEAESSGSSATLEGLGASLEWAEQARRRSIGDNPIARHGLARFPEFPDISDPWYDGRGHHYTIVDTPQEGSVLTAAEVTAIVKSEFWDPLCESATAWCWRDGSWQPVQSEWYSSSSRRLKQFLGDTAATAYSRYTLAMVTVYGGWSAERMAEATREFVSGSPKPVQLVCGSAYLGPGNALVLQTAGTVSSPPAQSIGSLLSLHYELLSIEQQARSQGIETLPSSSAKCRELRKHFINAISEYHASPTRTGESPDDRAIRLAMEEVLRIDRRRESASDLLQLLDDEEQEASEWRLSRLGLILAIMGVMQTVIAAFEAVEASWGANVTEGRSRFHAVWANATFGVTAIFAVFAITMIIPFFQRLYGRTPVLRRFFPEHAGVSTRRIEPL
jgi:hypothetical protein